MPYEREITTITRQGIRAKRGRIIAKELQRGSLRTMNGASGRSFGSKTTILWQDLTVSVPPSERVSAWTGWRMPGRSRKAAAPESVRILEGVSGHAETGDLIAIMGPRGFSGAGKTTLLGSIAGRIEPTRGFVEVNGRPISRKALSRISSYVPQFEALPGYLTVREYLTFACALRGNGLGSQTDAVVDRTLLELTLSDHNDAILSSLSAGEKKRLSLAAELLAQPRILFLDEPTTGLDAYSAKRTIDSLRSVSERGTIVFCSIHQPGARVYGLFDRAIFLTGGRLAYFGSSENAADFFSSMGYRCPTGYDESEYYVNVLSARESVASSERVRGICEEFARSRSRLVPSPGSSASVAGPSIDARERKVSGIVQLRWLLWRARIQNRRRLFADWIGWLSCLLSIATVGSFYAGVRPVTQPGVQNARGALYTTASEIIFTVAYSVIYELPADLPVFVRETALYGPGPYFLAVFLSLMPNVIAKAFLFTIVLYCALALERGVLDFLLYCVSTTAAAISGAAYGVMFSSWIPDIEIATTVMVPIDMVFLLTAGIFYNLRSLPTYLACFKYFSIFFYVNEALSILYWVRVERIECEADPDLPCLRNGTEVLSENGFDRSNYTRDIVGLLLLAILMAFLGYLGIRRRRRPARSFESAYI